MNKRFLFFVMIVAMGSGVLHAGQKRHSRFSSKHDLHFTTLAKSWDEAIPLGNGLIGALIWQKGGTLRFSLDRADLWDLRPVQEFSRPEFRFAWVREQVLKDDYKPVQELGDVPYERDPAPTKIPAGALEFDLSQMGKVAAVDLRLKQALCVVKWESGATLETFVHATEPFGWFKFEKVPIRFAPKIVPPPYGQIDTSKQEANSWQGNDLRRLGYSAPQITESGQKIKYHQEGWNGFNYDIEVAWSYSNRQILFGYWTITTKSSSEVLPKEHLKVNATSFVKDYFSHVEWWKKYWQQSSIQLPDSILETQWYREQYKFGSASRRGAPPITLQAVWTADNGRIPPWKGDYHHDLNTQLSYWPCYSANHLEEGLSFLDWLWETKTVAAAYTKTYFEKAGLNYPGVSTLTGAPMGGWIQYSMSPTVSAWLAQHFYLHWRYSMDREFLRTRAYPWLRDVAIFLDELSIKKENGKRQLPLSSAPEVNDNRIDAWFHETTNYDLALIRWLYGAATELAQELGLRDDAEKWRTILSAWPELARSEVDQKLLLAPNVELHESHRHLSHLMAIHPLGLINWDNSESDRQTIAASLQDLDRLGTDWWTGYSFSWLGNLWARARDGDRAAQALKTFATCFCLPNSFHVNGDQSGTGKSKFTYRPFTLEGNFAFAAGVQEMLLQSHNGVIRIFPAIPANWKNLRFENLRAEGAFLVSAIQHHGDVQQVKIRSEKGGRLHLANPFRGRAFKVKGVQIDQAARKGEIIEIATRAGMEITLRADK